MLFMDRVVIPEIDDSKTLVDVMEVAMYDTDIGEDVSARVGGEVASVKETIEKLLTELWVVSQITEQEKQMV